MTRKSAALGATGAVVLATVGIELAYRHLAHAESWWHTIPGFDFAFGFLSCAAIVIGSKWVGHAFVQRDEDFYEREG